MLAPLHRSALNQTQIVVVGFSVEVERGTVAWLVILQLINRNEAHDLRRDLDFFEAPRPSAEDLVQRLVACAQRATSLARVGTRERQYSGEDVTSSNRSFAIGAPRKRPRRKPRPAIDPFSGG